MKKTVILILIAAVALMAVSCGNKSKKKQKTIEDVAQEMVEEAFSGKNLSKEGAEHFTKANFGIKLSDLVPEFELGEAGERDFYGNEDVTFATYNKKDGEELGKEEYIEYVKKVYAATKAVADNGINIYGFEEKSDAAEANAEKTLDAVLDAGKGIKIFGIEVYMGNYAWSFMKDGKPIRCDLERLEKDDVGYAAKVKFTKGMEKSLDDLMKEADEILSDPENQKKIEEALKDLSK